MRDLLTPASERHQVIQTKDQVKQRAAEYGYEASYSGKARRWYFKPLRAKNLFPITKLRAELRAAGIKGVTAR